jgi:hypothetical protein
MVCILIALFLFTGISLAQPAQIDINTLIQETQKRSDKPGEMTFVWWIPEEYWKASFAQNPAMTAEQIEEFIKVFRPYTIIAVVDGTMGTYGKVNYKTEGEIRANLRVLDNQNNIYHPLKEEEINADTKSFLATMKPMLANALGPIGENMHFFLFPAQGNNGQSLADPKKEGAFLVVLGERQFRWKLPFGSLFAPKTCPTCGEKVSGVYKYCPWDGTKLE